MKFEDFVDDPISVFVDIQKYYELEVSELPAKKLTIKLGIDYEKKFKNIDEIKGWFD